MKTAFIQLLKDNLGQNINGQGAGFANWLNAKIHSVSDTGNIEVEFAVRPDMLNPFNILHGGAMAGIADEVMGLQLYALSGDDESFLALNLHIDFLKAVTPDETLIATANVTRKGRKTAHLTCILRSSKGSIVAQASSNFIKM